MRLLAISVETVSPTDLVWLLFGDLSWDTAIPTSIHFYVFDISFQVTINISGNLEAHFRFHKAK